jgi:hypothetical protein
VERDRNSEHGCIGDCGVPQPRRLQLGRETWTLPEMGTGFSPDRSVSPGEILIAQDLSIAEPSWLALRPSAAHTAPIWVTLDGRRPGDPVLATRWSAHADRESFRR